MIPEQLQNLLPEVVEKTPTGLALFDANTLRLMWCNAAFFKQRKTPQAKFSEEIGKNLTEFFYDNDIDSVHQNVEIALTQGIAFDFGRNLKSFRGSPSHIEYWLYPIARESETPQLCMLVKDFSVQKLNDEITKKNEQIEEILSSMDEGLVAVTSNFKMSEECSNEAKRILGVETTLDRDLRELFLPENPTEEQRTFYTQLENFLATAFNLFVPEQFSQIQEKAPKILKVEDASDQSEKTYGLNYSPIIKNGEIQRIIITFQDQTELATLRSEKQSGWSGSAIDAVTDFCSAMLRNPRNLVDQCEALKALAKQNKAMSRSSLDTDLKRKLHNLKGSARLVGLKSLEYSINQMENLVLQLENNGDQDKILSSLEQEFRRFGTFAEKVLELSSNHGASHEASWSSLKANLEQMTQETSRRLKKMTKLLFSLNGQEPPACELVKIETCLQHLITNAIDHGIELPTKRQALRKPESGLIAISVTVSSSSINIIVSDDGKGINAQKLWSKALEANRRTGELPKDISMQELLALLTEAGLSSKDGATEFSGRGIGMDAVAHEVKNAEGSLTLLETSSAGTTFEVQWPIPCPQNTSVQKNG